MIDGIDFLANAGTDSTTLRWNSENMGPSSPTVPLGRLAPLVQGVVSDSPDAPWVLSLLELLGNHKGGKWRDYAARIRSGDSDSLRRIRDGLETQTVVLVDPFELTRPADLALAGPCDGRPIVSAAVIDGRVGRHIPDVRRIVVRTMIEDSGAGVVARLMDAITSQYDGVTRRRPRTDPSWLLDVTPKTSLRRILAISGNATALVNSATRESSFESTWAAPLRFIDDSVAEGFVARERLAAIGRQRLLVDEGNDKAIDAVERLRVSASVVADSCGADSERGFVLAISDLSSVRVQVADFVAGYATDVLTTDGVGGLITTFGAVLYNGSAVDNGRAEEIDRVMRMHRASISRA